ncbi:MAG: hypothetical protein K6E32_01840 [Lachnospiraceae bacterium]|nr:hypothetical protein [Lachnospiraceae bacterium]
MKRRFAVILCLALIMVSVVGCGGNTSQKTEVEKQAEITSSTSAVKEEKTPAKDAEVTVAATEAVKEETTPEVTEEAKEEKTPTATEEPKEDKTQTATEETTTSAPVEETTAPPVEETTPETGYVIDRYIADNDFTDFASYGAEMGALTVDTDSDEWNVDFKYGSYFVSIGTNRQDPEYCYIGIGGEDNSTLTYACLVRYIDVPTLPLTKNGTFFPTSAAHMLEDTINYMKNHPDPNTKPDIPGMNFESWAVLIGG